MNWQKINKIGNGVAAIGCLGMIIFLVTVGGSTGEYIFFTTMLFLNFLCFRM